MGIIVVREYDSNFREHLALKRVYGSCTLMGIIVVREYDSSFRVHLALKEQQLSGFVCRKY